MRLMTFRTRKRKKSDKRNVKFGAAGFLSARPRMESQLQNLVRQISERHKQKMKPKPLNLKYISNLETGLKLKKGRGRPRKNPRPEDVEVVKEGHQQNINFKKLSVTQQHNLQNVTVDVVNNITNILMKTFEDSQQILKNDNDGKRNQKSDDQFDNILKANGSKQLLRYSDEQKQLLKADDDKQNQEVSNDKQLMKSDNYVKDIVIPKGAKRRKLAKPLPYLGNNSDTEEMEPAPIKVQFQNGLAF
ncbi:unnamed protein product [Bursaphelenchus okinawaensis]|uniref:Uncharacterized protein n=1 Tax=Bursaphelenchus okinawaensis TaxID=465554 RepID=A0A811KK92_9BILA|nr:unnamed protein product [Bursaphelenchus okinawaensis]CAG9105448.1 unnamed protein product [Bursaphelenchus okinawaensis]